MEFIKKYKIDILIVLAFIGFVLFLPNNASVWIDELFTLEFVELKVPELLKTTAKDIHPPLYYLVVKLFVNLFPFVDRAIIGKFVSLFVFFAFLLITYHYIKKYINDCVASTYAIVAMGCKILHYCFEMRMYTLATSLIVLAYISGYLLVTTKKHRFAIYTNICVLLAMYTHYYAVIAFLPLLIYLVVNFCKDKLYKLLVLSIVFQIVAYLPWLLYFVSLFSSNQAGIGAGYYFNVSELIISFVSFFSNSNIILTGITMAIFTVITLFAVRLSKSKQIQFGFVCLLPLISIFIFGNLLGLVFDKFFSGKYLLLSWNVFAFGIALFINEIKYRKVFVSFIFILNALSYSLIINEEFYDIEVTSYFNAFLASQELITCEGKYCDICKYYSDNVIIDESNDNVYSTEYVIFNNRIEGLHCFWFNPASVDMYVYKTSEYNQYLNNLR